MCSHVSVVENSIDIDTTEATQMFSGMTQRCTTDLADTRKVNNRTVLNRNNTACAQQVYYCQCQKMHRVAATWKCKDNVEACSSDQGSKPALTSVQQHQHQSCSMTSFSLHTIFPSIVTAECSQAEGLPHQLMHCGLHHAASVVMCNTHMTPAQCLVLALSSAADQMHWQ